MENKHDNLPTKSWIKIVALMATISFMWTPLLWAEPIGFYSLRPLAAMEREGGVAVSVAPPAQSTFAELKDQIVARIGRVFRPEGYGHGALLRRDGSRIVVAEEGFGGDDIRIRLAIEYERNQDVNGLYEGGYTCLEGACLINGWLRSLGIESNIWVGKTGLRDVHFYAKTTDGTRFSATPDLAYIDASIEDGRQISDVNAARLYSEYRAEVPVDEGLSPMSWKAVDESTAILVSSGIDIGILLDRYQTQEFNISFTYEADIIKNGEIIGGVKVIAKVPKSRLLEVQGQLAGTSPLEIVERLKSIGIEVQTTTTPGLAQRENNLILVEQQMTADILYYLIAKLDREIVDRFTQMPARPVVGDLVRALPTAAMSAI